MPQDTDRNRFSRGRDYHDDLIQDPERLRERIAESRDEGPAFDEEKIRRENYSLSDNIAKLALLVSSASVISHRRLLGDSGIHLADIATSLINKIGKTKAKAVGRYAAYLGESTGELNKKQASKLRKTAKDTPELAHLQIIKDLNTNLENLHRLDTEGVSIFTDTKEVGIAGEKIVAQMKKDLARRHSSDFNASESFENLTLDKVISMHSSESKSNRDYIASLFGETQIETLLSAKRLGLISDDQVIDERIFIKKSKPISGEVVPPAKGILKDFSRPEKIMDTRILSGRYLGGILERHLGELQIPFVNINIGRLFSAPIKHLFGEGDSSGIVRAPDNSDRHVRRLIIGEDLYRLRPPPGEVTPHPRRIKPPSGEIEPPSGEIKPPSGEIKPPSGEIEPPSGWTRPASATRPAPAVPAVPANKPIELEHIASGYRARESRDGMANAVIARRGQLASQTKRTATQIEAKSSNIVMQALDALQEDVGIGRRFATQEAWVKRGTIDLLKRRLQGTPQLKTTTKVDEIIEELAKRTGTSTADTSDLDFMGRAAQKIAKESRPGKPKLRKHEKIQEDLLAALGDESTYEYLKEDPKTGEMVKVIDSVRGSSPDDMGLRRASKREKIEVGRSDPGHLKTWVPMDSFAYESDLSSRLSDVANFMTTRLNDLIGATMGIGFKPTPGKFGFVGNTAKIFGLAAGTAVAFEGIKYADYLIGVPFGDYKPSNLLLDTYAVAKMSAQYLREFTGLSPAARYMEDLMPGSIESSMSEFARTLAPFAIALKMLPVKESIILATGVSAAIGEFPFPGITDTPKETTDILSGEQQVPIRSGRYWMLGKQPFEGGKIDYFAPGMFARMRSEYKYTDTLYGSQTEYFQNTSFLPTPSNLFRIPELVGNVLSPLTNLPFLGSLLEHAPLIGSMFDPQGAEFLAQKHRFDRPYPTAFSIEELSNSTIGSMGVPGGNSSGLSAYQTPGESIVEMGMNPYPMRSELNSAVKSPFLSTAVSQVSELSGIYKFGLWDMPFKSSVPTSPQLADPGFMNSTTRAFYDESVGGLMGHTELLRRFVMSDYLQAQRQATNTIPNTMPTWLPGSRSSFTGNTAMGVFPGDRNYHIDFSTGDPYAKIPHGEFRLPGAAREVAFRLHSGSPGIYDAVDRLMVLSDVAPNSESYKHYRIIVESMIKAGSIDQYWTDKLVKTREGVEQKLERYQTVSRKFNGIGSQLEPIVGLLEANKNEEGIRTYYTPPEQALGSAWEVFSHDVVSRIGISIPILGPIISNKMLPMRDELEAYLKREVYDTDEYDWTKPYSTMIRPMHEQLKATDPFTAGAGGFISGALMAANPISRIVMSSAGAMYFSGASSLRAISTGELTGGYVPGYVTERRRADEYFDKLEYIKLRRLEKSARAEGMHDIAEHFMDLKRRTISSLDYSLGTKQFVRDALIALPTREKQLFMGSLNAPTGKRQQMLPYIPEHLKPVYQAAWAKQGSKEFSYSDIKQNPDVRAAEYFMQHGMPDPTWAGFHPDIPMDAVRVKTMDSIWGSPSNDLHRSGVFAVTANRLRTEFPDVDLSVYNFYQRSGLDAAAKQQLEAELMQSGITDYDIDENLGSGLDNIVNYDMSSRSGLENFFAIATDILRG